MTVFPGGDEREASWDLLALVVVSGVVKLGYRVWHRAFGPRLAIPALAALALAAIIAVLAVLLRANT